MKSAPFARMWNKWLFVLGVMTVIVHAFMLGRYPHGFYYDFHCVFCTSMVLAKWLYYKSRGWHYYMTDWCYTANALLVLFLTFQPKNHWLFKACFLHANGGLAVAIAAFRNQMVFHNFDNLTSLALHILPLLVTYNIRWNTIPYEATLPKSERRFFSDDDEFSWIAFFVIPMGLYCLHTIVMYCINFVFAKKRIAQRNYETMFIYFERQKSWHKIFYKFGDRWAEVVFVGV